MRCECDQQPVPMDSTDMVFTSHSMGPAEVGRSVDPAHLDSSASVRNSDNGVSKMNMRPRRTPGVACVDSPNRHPSGVLYSPSHLETILQGQELLVNTNLSSSTSPRMTFSPGRTVMTDGPGDPLLSPPVKSIPCCPCRGTESPLFTRSSESKNDSHGGPSAQVRNGDNNNNKYATRSSSNGNTTLNGQDSKPGVHWACDSRRLRNSPGPVVRVSSDEEMTLIGNKNATSNQLKSDPSRCGTVGFPAMASPDTIDPRRLPKSHGPASASLEFSNKPLQPHFLPPSSSPTPIPKSVGTNRSSALKSPSWKIRKPLAKVRWLSQSVSNDSKRQEDSLLSCSAECHSLDGHLISSALDEVKGAMDMLAGKSQPPPSGCGRTRPVRFKRASESERVLMISKSLPDTKDIAPPCSFGHFDEDHMYGALFRCSTCYDALPGSGKLIILDSRLGVIRAIRALLENGIQAAPIWHSALQKVVGLFSRDIALHLLASLCPEKQSSAEPAQQVPTNGVGSSVDCSPEKTSSLASGLAKWGKKQLLDVLRLFYQEPDEHTFELTESALIVSPQTVLRKVFCLLTHHHKHRGSSTDRHHHSPQSCKQSDVNIHHLLEEHYDCCFELDPPEIESKDALTTDPSKSQYRHSSEPVVAAHCAVGTQSSKNQQAFSVDGNSSHGPSAACSIPSLSNPSHVIVVDPNSGNALGLLNTNRLLVYLRMRSEELPCSPQIISPVGCIPGLRWAERCTLNARNRTRSGSGSSLSTTSDLFQASDPVLLSTTTCSEAISRLIEWLPYLPCLPVVYMNEGAATQPTALLGFVSPGDILQLVLEDSPDVAITQPVSRIFNSRSNLGRWQRDWICYTHEPIITVLDRMVRLRAPCLALCDSPKRGLPVFGLPIGVVTARDLLHTVVTTRSTSQRHHPKLVHQSSSSSASVEAALENSSKWSKSSSLCEYDDGISLSHEFGSDRSMDPSTTSQSAGKLKTNSDSLLGLSNSLSQASSTSSASTYSACCSDGDEDGGTERIQRPQGRRLSLTEEFQCSCPCHQDNSGNTKSREPVRTRSLKVKPTYGPKSNFSSPSSQSQQVHSNSVNDQIRQPHTAVAAASSPTEARGSRSTSRRLASKIPDWLTTAAARLPAVNKQPVARTYTASESGDRIVSPGHGKKRDDDDGVFPMD